MLRGTSFISHLERTYIKKLLLILMISFTSPILGVDYFQLADECVSEFEKKALDDSTKIVATGGGYMDGVEDITIDLDVKKKVGLEEARRIYVEKINLLIDIINSKNALRPYLYHYPATIRDIKLFTQAF